MARARPKLRIARRRRRSGRRSAPPGRGRTRCGSPSAAAMSTGNTARAVGRRGSRPTTCSQDDRRGRQRGGQQRTSRLLLPRAPSAKPRVTAETLRSNSSPAGHLQAADHPARVAVMRPRRASRIDDRPEAEPTREHAEARAPDGDRPRRRPAPVPLAPEHLGLPSSEGDGSRRVESGERASAGGAAGAIRPTRRLPLAGLPDDGPDPPRRCGGQQRRGQEPERAEPGLRPQPDRAHPRRRGPAGRAARKTGLEGEGQVSRQPWPWPTGAASGRGQPTSARPAGRGCRGCRSPATPRVSSCPRPRAPAPACSRIRCRPGRPDRTSRYRRGRRRREVGRRRLHRSGRRRSGRATSTRSRRQLAQHDLGVGQIGRE